MTLAFAFSIFFVFLLMQLTRKTAMISVKRPQSDTRAVASQRQDGRLGQRPCCNANKAYDVDAFLRLSGRVVSSTTRPVLHMCMAWTPSMAIYSRCTHSSSATKVAINLLCVVCTA